MAQQVTLITGTSCRIELDYHASIGWYAEIYFGDSFWNYVEFGEDKLKAQCFMDDPLACYRTEQERKAKELAEKEQTLVAYYAMDYMRISYGRRIGPYPHC